MNNAKGFSLIELMVVIAIMSILAGFAVPNFVDQVNNNKIRDVEADMHLAIGRARGIALRNEFGNFGVNANTVVCFDSNTSTLALHGATVLGTAATCGNVNAAIWSKVINNDITLHNVVYTTNGSIVTRSETDFTQIAFNNSGNITTDGCVSCSTNNTLIIKLNNSVDSGDKVFY